MRGGGIGRSELDWVRGITTDGLKDRKGCTACRRFPCSWHKEGELTRDFGFGIDPVLRSWLWDNFIAGVRGYFTKT